MTSISDLYWGIGILLAGLFFLIFSNSLSNYLGKENDKHRLTKNQLKFRTVIGGITFVIIGDCNYLHLCI